MNRTVITALATAYLLSTAPQTQASVRLVPPSTASSVTVIPVKAKKRPTISYRLATPRPGDKLVGRVRPNRQQQANDAAAAMAILGIVGLGVGLAVAGRHHGGGLGNMPLASGSGCGVDYTHKNTQGCGGYIPTPAGDNGLHGPYKCLGPNGWYVSRTMRSGCYMASMDASGHRMSDSLR